MDMFCWTSLFKQGDLHRKDVLALLRSNFESIGTDAEIFKFTKSIFPGWDQARDVYICRRVQWPVNKAPLISPYKKGTNQTPVVRFVQRGFYHGPPPGRTPLSPAPAGCAGGRPGFLTGRARRPPGSSQPAAVEPRLMPPSRSSGSPGPSPPHARSSWRPPARPACPAL
jgi:hypothetical protein